MKTCAVIVAAYRAQEWIEEMIASFHGQVPHPGWHYDLRLGVDGCSTTTYHLTERGYEHYYSRENVGAYIMRNSLIRLAPASAYAIFDADDIMLPLFLTTLLSIVEERRIAGPARLEMKQDSTWRQYPFSSGITCFPHEALSTLGAFRPDRVVGDSDFILRAQDAGWEVEGTPHPIYIRRIHGDNITRSPTSGIKSPVRRRIRDKYRRLRENGHLYAPPETTPLKHIRT